MALSFASPVRSASRSTGNSTFCKMIPRAMSLVSPYLHRSETLAPAAGVCIFPLCLTRMRLLVLLLLVTFSIALRADELTFDSYSCAITMPDGESWQRGLPQAIKDG